jgi:hypothetical protein
MCAAYAAQKKQNKTMQSLKEYKLVRQGDRPLAFRGEIIGTGEIGNERSGVTIRIYRTEAKHYIAEIERRNIRGNSYQQYDVESPPYRNASHGATPAEIIDWLKEGERSLGKASQDAIEKACENDSEFAASWVERVE